MEGNRIVPYFQPIVNLRTNVVSGFEVLARCHHPERGLLLPQEFLPAVEKAGCVGKFTEKLLLFAARSASAWPRHLTISLNISARELRDRSLPERLKQAACEGGLSLNRLIIEITEKAILDHLAWARPIVEDLKSLGIRLSLDDLGAGYSSLSHLQALPFDQVKIDACFVRQIDQRRECRKIVAAMVGLGLSMGLMTVAEGVEEESQAEILARLGCDSGQGWLFGRPVAAEDMPEQIALFQARSRAASASQEIAVLEMEATPSQRLAELRAIYDGAPVGFCFLDKDLRFLSLNSHLAKIHKLPATAHLGRTLYEVLPDLPASLRPCLEKVLVGESISNLKVALGRPGAQVRLSLSCRPVKDECGEVIGISVVVFDVAEQKNIGCAL